MLKNIVRIQYNSDFTLNCKLPNGYDNQDFIIRLYTTDKDDYYEASYLNGEYINCLTDSDNQNIVIYVNSHNLQPGCLHVGMQIDYDNTHFADNVENIITAEETNVYLVKQNANATSAMYVGSALPDLTGSSDFVTQSDLEFELLNYYTKEDIDNASYISSADLNDFVTEEELNDMGFLSAAQLDAMGYTTKDYVDTKTSQKQDRLISAVNIKTINGNSLLGNGNISISGISQDDLDNAIAPLVSQEALVETLSSYVSHAELNSASYATQSFVDDAIADVIEDSNFMTEADVNNLLSTASYLNQSDLELQLNQAGYVTSTQLSAMGYITNQDLAETLSNATYVTSSELSNAGYVTESEISSMGYATESYVSDYVAQHAPTPDLSAYVTKTELSNAGYLTSIPNTYATYAAISNMGYITSIPSEYVTQSELSGMGYLTAVPSEYVTETEIAGMGYVTSTELSNIGYITSIPSEYVTESELSAMSYATTSQLPNMSDYISKTELSNASYVTQSSLSNMGYITAIPNEYVTESELSAKSYATTTQLATKQDTLVSGTNIKTVNNNSLLGSGNITISSSGNLIAEVTQAEYDAMQQAGTLDPNTIYVITDAPATDLSYYVLQSDLENMGYVTGTALSNMSYATTSQLPNMSDYVSKTELNNASYVTQTQLNNAGYVSQSQLSQAGYLTSIPNTYATYAAISNMGYITSANFIYDNATYTLTILI